MDEKTVIARPKKPTIPEVADPREDVRASNAEPNKTESFEPAESEERTVILRNGSQKPAVTSKEKPATGKSAPAKASLKEKQPGPQSAASTAASGTFYFFLTIAILFAGLGVALLAVHFFSSDTPQVVQIADSDLKEDIVPVATPESAAEDEALIMAAIKPRVIELSGDPIILRQLANAPRQLIKLQNESQLKAASMLGVKSDLYRLKDVLDVPNIGLQNGVIGSQDDIASVQPNQGDFTPDDSSVITANSGTPANRIADYAQLVPSEQSVASYLKLLGMETQHSQEVETAFEKIHNRKNVSKGDKVAVRAVSSEDTGSQLVPVQISIYSTDGYVGSVAMNDIDAYTDAADPWYGADIFDAELLPTVMKDEDRPRLLDAIYATALRNRIPTPVVGEAIMMLSRSQDLERKVETGDTITIIYSPQARDPKTGLGRVVFIRIGRSSGNLDCFVMQAQQGAQFECVAQEGQGTINRAGMVTPVNGVIVAKFGTPNANSDVKTDAAADVKTASQDDMNFGVDWTAPKGSPVVAAYAGDVTALGQEGKFGLVVRLTHADGKTTMYGYLDRVPAGIVAGAKVTAGQTIGFVGTPSSSREPRLHFELLNNGVPVDPIAEMASMAAGVGGAVEQFVGRIIHIESANRCDARNPLSTAVGLGQFIESTWMTTIKIHRPDIFEKHSRAEILDMRTDCDLARAMTTAFTRDNAAVIRQSGHPVTPGNLYLAHFLGVGGALKALSSDANRQIAEVFGASHVKANPFEAGKSIGYLISWAAKKMTGSTPAKADNGTSSDLALAKPSAANASTGATAGNGVAGTSSGSLTQYATDPLFTQVKSAVNSLLQ